MARNSDLCRSHCPINFVLETFGDRWTLLVVRDLMFHGKQTFGEFLKSDEGIATNILADRLKRLEAHEIVEKSAAPDNKSKLIYRLTDKGKDLLPVMLEIAAWSARHDASTNASKEFAEKVETSREKLIGEILGRLEQPRRARKRS